VPASRQSQRMAVTAATKNPKPVYPKGARSIAFGSFPRSDGPEPDGLAAPSPASSEAARSFACGHAALVSHGTSEIQSGSVCETADVGAGERERRDHQPGRAGGIGLSELSVDSRNQEAS